MGKQDRKQKVETLSKKDKKQRKRHLKRDVSFVFEKSSTVYDKKNS